MRNRIAGGAFATVIFGNEDRLTGYIGEDPSDPPAFRMDGYILTANGSLQQVSIRLLEDEIRTVHFLPEAPEFLDTEGNSMTMEPGFFRDIP